ncbi:DUF1788 domain-containing protein [Desulfonatronovibrio magnus]|uniref:DUF1788 domain-containing protein n=1 Tax=Desulfonatronovibrio magnus TaxID=698827 RepID=UPI0005EB9EDB|nr:DUF1788 domain-containing protein [Desulfonatronovibrio magnus]
MSTNLEHRLNKLIDRLLSPELLAGSGIGNEVAFYIFDYPPEEEIRVRKFIAIIKDQISKRKPDLCLAHVDLFQLVVDYLKDRKILDLCYDKQKKEGDQALLSALKDPLNIKTRLSPYFVQKVKPEAQDLVLLSGVGSAWPLVRTHSLLNNLQSHMQNKPLVVFYPGYYDGLKLHLFGRVKEKNYYRAFRLAE